MGDNNLMTNKHIHTIILFTILTLTFTGCTYGLCGLDYVICISSDDKPIKDTEQRLKESDL